MLRSKSIVVSLLLASAALMVSFSGNTRHEAETTSESANRYFWDQLHQGNYDSINTAIAMLEKVYRLDPHDFKTTAHLGFANMWAFCERGRREPDSARVVSFVFASNMYFKRAIRLNPHDPRLRGFQSATDICTGGLSRNPVLLLRGYFNGKKAIRGWSLFNKSALSFVESQMDSGSFFYNNALRYQWEVIDECSCKKLDRNTILSNPEKTLRELVSELQGSSDKMIRRACWNSWIAPHNLEGFLLNFGDMLVKQGDPQHALSFYRAAALSPTYHDWPFKSVIEERIRDIAYNEKIFNREMDIIYPKDSRQIFINSKISCVGCHQMGKEEFARTPYQEPGDDIYFIRKK